jgi:uncharacterized tellurite resistance protein B-like protein
LDPIKLEHFRNLVSLVAADGTIQESEKVALSKIAYNNGIPLDRLNVMLKHADEYQYFIPQNNHEREKQLEDMLDLAHVDGDMAPAELELIKVVAGRLGFSDAEIAALLVDYQKRKAST